MPNQPRVGDFRSPPDNEPRVSTPAATPTASPAPTVETAGTAEGAPATPAPLTPREQYMKRLEEAEIPLEIAASIFDAVLEKGYYEEYVSVGKQKAVFRTRQYEDAQRLQVALEARRPTMVVTQEDMINKYNLAASLHMWKGVVIKRETDDDFDKALAAVHKMPAPLVSLLMGCLMKFDRKTLTVFSDGANDFFS